MSFGRLAGACVTAGIFWMTMCAAADLSLVENGVSRYRIALPGNASDVEQTAAKELQHFLELSTGVALPIVIGEADSPAIRVGGTYAANAKLEADGIVIRTEGEDVILAGEGKRGTLYAVYEFLNRVPGVRFYAPDCTLVPRHPVLTMPEMAYEYTPPFEVREMCTEVFIADPVFAARNKINGQWEYIPESFGGHEEMLGWCHTFERWLSPEKYFDAHPEWYSLYHGERIPNGQLCLSNPEMRKALTEEVLRQLRAAPDTRVISVSQNDNDRACQCEKCKELDARYGSVQSGILLDCINEVAAAVRKEFPNVRVETLAYWYTVNIPETIVPADNVMIRLCVINASVTDPIASEKNATFLHNLNAWSAVSRQLALWNYLANFMSYISPHPNMENWACDLRTFRDNRCKWIFEQAGSSLEDFAEMRAWVAAQLLWNPDLDQAALQQEFLENYYGAAAPYLAAYRQLLMDELKKHSADMNCYSEATDKWLSYEGLLKALDLMTLAETAVAADPVLMERVARAKLPVNYTLITRGESFVPENLDTKRFMQAVRETAAVLEKHAATAYREGIPANALLPMLNAASGTKKVDMNSLPPEFRSVPAENIVVLNAEEMILIGTGNKIWLAPDSNAATVSGQAAWMRGNHGEWLAQCPFPALMHYLSPKWEVYACIRAVMPDGTPPSDAKVALAGIYDPAVSQGESKQLSSREIAGNEYRCIHLGEFNRVGQYAYIAPIPPGKAAQIWIERMILVKK